jgi:hypothetical protein
MSNENYYNLCCRYQGRHVRIDDRRGNVHVGRISRVTRSHVFIQPTRHRGNNGYGGYGYGGYGGYYGDYGYGEGYGLALGAITGIALASLFFW